MIDDLPYASLRVPVFAEACVATSQPLAAQAGLAMLARGGNAVDAAVAAAITLTVVEPTMNGVGADLFATLHHDGRLHCLNASGRSPAGLLRSRLPRAGQMPLVGWDTVTVPGAVSGWVALSRRFGRLPFAELFGPAVGYARRGFLVPTVVALQWRFQQSWFAGQPGFADAFLPGGTAPHAGERFVAAALAETLEQIAASDGEAFYRGTLAARIDAASRAGGGCLRADDLAAHAAEWVTPLARPYRGVDVNVPPPNGQGIAVLIALGILQRIPGFETLGPDRPRRTHLMVQAMRLALAELDAFVGDPAAMTTGPDGLLADARLDRLAHTLARGMARPGPPASSRAMGTVYVAAADRDGTMVSLIQSNFRGFGSGIVVPGAGIALNNRASGFSLADGHPNEAGPGKRPLSTIIPTMLTRGPDAVAAFGVMGGMMQAQAQVQFVTRLLDLRQNVQACLDAPRWMVTADGALLVEETVPGPTRRSLVRHGHRLAHASRWSPEIGAGQAIVRQTDGYVAATESRRDGIVAAL